MTDNELVHLVVADGVATVTLDSPHNRNALSRQLVAELTDRLGSAGASPDVRAIVLTHTGTTFCAGADLSEASTGPMTGTASALLALLRLIVVLPRPVIASIHGNVRAGIHMLLEHAAVIHFVNMVARQNKNVFGALAADGINILINRVGGASVPVGGHALLRRQQLDELAESTVEKAPAALHVADQALRLVLGADADAAHTRVDAVGERKIDDTKFAAEWHGGLCAPVGQWSETAAAAPRQHDRERIPRELRHEQALRVMLGRTIAELRGFLIDGHGSSMLCLRRARPDHDIPLLGGGPLSPAHRYGHEVCAG